MGTVRPYEIDSEKWGNVLDVFIDAVVPLITLDVGVAEGFNDLFAYFGTQFVEFQPVAHFRLSIRSCRARYREVPSCSSSQAARTLPKGRAI